MNCLHEYVGISTIEPMRKVVQERYDYNNGNVWITFSVYDYCRECGSKLNNRLETFVLKSFTNVEGYK